MTFEEGYLVITNWYFSKIL